MDLRKLLIFAAFVLVLAIAGYVTYQWLGGTETAEDLRDEVTGQRAIEQGESMQETLRQVSPSRQELIEESGALDP